MNFGNNGAGVRDVVTSVRNDYMCVYPKFGLGAESWQRSCRSDGTHVKDTKNPIQFQLPGNDRLIIFLRVKISRDWISFTLDVLLDLGHSPTIEC